MKNLLCVVGLTFCVACSTAIVRPYVGEQQGWPVASGSIVNTRYDLPVFTTLPPAPYTVIAELRVNSPLYAQPEEGHLPMLVKKAIEIGADALVLVEGRVYFSTTYGVPTTGTAGGTAVSLTSVNRFNPETFRQGVNVIAIRWTGKMPAGLPPRYARYSEDMLEPAEPAVPTEPSEPAPAPVDSPRSELPAAPAPSQPPAAAPATPVATP